jgi:hypothetical protein
MKAPEIPTFPVEPGKTLQSQGMISVLQRLRESEKQIQLQHERTMLQRITRPAVKPSVPNVQGDFETRLNSARGGGSPLDRAFRAKVEPAMGADFSGVKVHTDAEADRLNRSIQAKAFTTGQDIFFRQGTYEPGSEQGQELLAHELTHVVQQVTPQIASRFIQRDDGEEGEQTESSAEEDFQPFLVTTNDWRVLRQSGIAVAGHLRGVQQIVVLTDRVRVFHPNGELLGSFTLRGNFRMVEGWYLIGSDGNFQLGLREGHTTTRSIGFDPEQLSEELRTRVQDRRIIYWTDWVNITPERESQIFRQPALLMVSSVVPAQGEATSTEQEREQAGGYGTEFQTEERRGRPYDYPPLPATIRGLNVQPVSGTGIYAMDLDYRFAASNLLQQASWAFQYTGYRWEVWDISNAPNVREQAEQVRRGRLASEEGGSGRTVGRTEGTASHFERTTEDIAQRPEQIRRDRAEAVEEGRYLDALANDINESLIGLEVLSRYGSQVLGAVGNVFADDQEREIPWNREGIFVVRCIAVIDPSAVEENESARAPSVATKVVIVQPIEQVSREALEAPLTQVAELEMQLALLLALPEDDPARAAIPQLRQQIATQQLEATGSPQVIITHRLEEKCRELQQARSSSIFLRAGMRDSQVSRLEREVRELEGQLRLVQTRARQISRTNAPARRARGVLISRVTGQTYPLLLQIGEPFLEGNTWKCDLSDVTSRDANRYTGEAPNNPNNEQEAKLGAVWEAVERFAGDVGYGEGSLTISLPESGWFANLSARQRTQTIPSRPRDWTSARARLEELATVIALIGLVVTAPAVAFAGAGLAAALAGERIARRVTNDTFRWDSQTVGDLIDVVSAAATGVRAFGSLRYFTRPGGGFVLRLARGAGQAAEVTEEALDVAGVILCNAETADQLLEIEERVRNREITRTEARRQRAQILTSAIQSNGLTFASRLRSTGAGERPPEGEVGGATPRTGETIPRPESEGTTPRSEVAPPRAETSRTGPGLVPSQRLELHRALGDLQGRVEIFENPLLAGTWTVHVRYDEGRVRLEVGDRVQPRHIRYHLATVRQLRRYEGVLGRIRRFFHDVGAILTRSPQFGTEGFEARLEVRKLREIIAELEAMQAQIDQRAARLSEDSSLAANRAEQEAIAREIASIEEQLTRHEAEVNSVTQGRGYIAAEDTTVLTQEEIDAFREHLQILGRQPGATQASQDALSAFNEILNRSDLTREDLQMMMRSLEESVTYRRGATRDRPMETISMEDPEVLALLETTMSHPTLEGNPDWQNYVELVRTCYRSQGTLEIGRSPRTTDPSAVANTNRMRAEFIAAMIAQTALPEAMNAVRQHLDTATAIHGSQDAAVAAGDAVWIDPQNGSRLQEYTSGAILWPTDPTWGVWRVDHIVELQHGGADNVSNYFPVPQSMHSVKTAAMALFGRTVRDRRLLLE